MIRIKTLPGDQVLLQPLTVDDVTDRYVGWMNDPAISRYLESRFETHTLDSVRSFVANQVGNPHVHFWKIVDRESATHVGNIKLGPIHPQHGVADIGLMIGDSGFHGRGIGRQAVQLVTDFALNDLKLAKVTAHAYEVNHASMCLFESLGFQIEGRLRAHRICGDQRVAFIAMGKIRDE